MLLLLYERIWIDMNILEKNMEFDKVKEIWRNLAQTEWAKKQIDNIEICMSQTELAARQRETTQAKLMMEKCGNPPLISLSGIEELLEVAVKGGCLSAAQLEKIGDALVAVKRMKSYLNNCKKFDISLAYDEEKLDPLDDVRELIREQIRGGSIDDAASKLLKELRFGIEAANDEMRKKADVLIRSNKEYVSDSFSTIRGGHICIPVKKEYKLKFTGSVIDKSATGNTLFIEPAPVAKLYEKIQLLKIDEENEERRILYELTAVVADSEALMLGNIRAMERFDYIFSKGRLSFEYDGNEPVINTERRIKLQGARHPLMDRKQAVPLQFEIGNGIRGIVITGPNTGGKTVAIKMVALNCMMAQCGLHVACREADICMNGNFLCDIGDGQNLSENLSTFSAHIINVLDILKKTGPDSLVVMDELGSGTDPAEGMGIAVAILEELKKSGALFLVTTHYPEVKNYADKTEGIINARMTFDKESLKPTYRLVIGEAGESCAFYIAKKLGMPQSMLRRAALEAYGGNAEALSSLASGGESENDEIIKKEARPKIIKAAKTSHSAQKAAGKFNLGDSVMVYPDKKIGIVCKTTDDKGMLEIQMKNKKIRVNHKRIKLHVAAAELYPEDYDFSIIFDSVANRKIRHDMNRKFVPDKEIVISDGKK